MWKNWIPETFFDVDHFSLKAPKSVKKYQVLLIVPTGTLINGKEIPVFLRKYSRDIKCQPLPREERDMYLIKNLSKRDAGHLHQYLDPSFIDDNNILENANLPVCTVCKWKVQK